MESGDIGMAIGCTNVIQGRCQRLMQVITQDMEDHDTRYSSEHVERLEQTMKRMKQKSES